MSAELERRFLGECRADVDGGDRRIRGTAIVFNSRSVNLGGFHEVILPGAVDRTLTEAMDVHAFWNHDSGEVLGRTRAGTLQLRKGQRGLDVIIDPPSWADKILESIRRGDVTGMSFGFRVPEGGDDWRMGDDGMPLREVHDMIVSEVSIVSKPAYQSTNVSARSLDALREFVRKDWRQDKRAVRLRLAR
jgi:HK97 family phage prohead protease